MKYFAMIGGRQCGPYTLDELHDAGVTPETYVWCKEMEDWRPAAEVADICRYWRQRLAGTLPAHTHTGAIRPETAVSDIKENPESENTRYFGSPTIPDIPSPESLFEPEDPAIPPKSMLVPAILTTLACFPVTGFMAIYYAVLTRRCWSAAEGGAPDAADLRRQAHDASRSARMWTGITFFLGMIFWAFMITFAAG